MSVALIAFDLDGTLLDNNKNIPPENLRALYAAHEAGILLVPATGRILKGMPEDLMKTGLFRYFIFSNGAIIYDLQKERVIHRAEIAPSLAVEVCQYLDGLPVLYDCYRGGFGYITGAMLGRLDEYFRLEPEIRKLVERLRAPVPDLKEDILRVGRPLEKMQAYFRPEDEALRQKQFRDIPARFPLLAASSSNSNNIELNSVLAGKGKALQKLCALLGVNPADSVAFGDGLNDQEMLLAAGRGCAMGNASPDIKECADITVENNRDAGVGKEIFRLLS